MHAGHVSSAERVREMLVPGGAWVNLGPLLWHYEGMAGETSVELAWDELRLLILAEGFSFEREEPTRCAYTRNPASMYQMEYECVHFVARAPSTPIMPAGPA